MVGATVTDEPDSCAEGSVILGDKRRGEATKSYPQDSILPTGVDDVNLKS
jgi:hypothetical protein